MNKILINLLRQNSSEKAGARGEDKRYHHVQLSMKNYLKRSSSNVHCGNATIWLNHQMMGAVVKKKMMVLLAMELM